ncbi:MAG: glycosyltransferase family 9 protein [Bacteriovoracia bacterium]
MKLRSKPILVVKSRAIGDTVLLTGSLRLLRKNFPKSPIHVLVRSPAGQLLEGLPYVDRIICTKEPRGKFDRVAYWARIISRLRNLRYSYVLNFHASFRSAMTCLFCMAQKVVTNHHELNGRNWFSDVEVPGRGVVKSNIDRDLDVLRAIGIKAEVKDALPELRFLPAEIEEMKEVISKNTKNPQKNPVSIFLGIGGSRDTKRWEPDLFARMTEILSKKLGARFLIASIDSDKRWLEKFFASFSNQEILNDFVHLTNLELRQTACVIANSDIYVGNDSGMKHVAAAVGKPTVSLFGPEAPLEWHPYDTNCHPYFFIEGLECRTESGKHWCSIPSCVKHDHKCMKQILPEQVAEKVIQLMTTKSREELLSC